MKCGETSESGQIYLIPAPSDRILAEGKVNMYKQRLEELYNNCASTRRTPYSIPIQRTHVLSREHRRDKVMLNH